ncbi:MAG TPA: PaaI family thioesterase [Sphingomonas sp.]|uniref:PaaI family thioesterase n=1 Tax=Sphingomonas sp. TaxID=28214 RepID=UPI002CC2810F|nr:PaaI family thioesterase [Sphingomonas sp.]HMI18719.1 PaaI family thioesterase [Sphingomonas sp.]
MSTGFDPAALLASAKGGHIVALGLRFVAQGADWCEFAIDYDRRLVSDAASGILASGPIVSLMDTAAGFAVWTKRGGFKPQATLDLRLDYLRPSRPGQTMTGRAECYRLTRRIAFVRGLAHDGDPDDPVAHLTATYMILGDGK